MAKKQLNLRVSDLTRQQVGDLRRWWGTSATETITLIVAREWERARNERNERGERSTMAYAGWSITMVIDEAGLGDMTGLDIEASMYRFAHVLEAELVRRYPGAEIDVRVDTRTYNGGSIRITGPEGADYPEYGVSQIDRLVVAVGDIAGHILSDREPEWAVPAA